MMAIDTVAAIVFWAGPVLTLYVYGVFPAVIIAIARMRRIDSPPTASPPPSPPAVSVIIAAHNEETHLRTRIANVLASSYPRASLEVIVVSDASTDGTNAIASSFATDGVRLIVQETRRGKTAGLNMALPIARGEIVVFTDANAEYSRATIASLVRHFEDSKVGLVTGHTRYAATAPGEVSEATSAHAALELAIKRAESRWGCCVGADGAVFAMRRSLYRPLRDDDINDLVLPLSVISAGYRCVLADGAHCAERPGATLESEFRRQSRITNRSLRAIWRHSHLLDPIRFPAFSLFLWSHKVLRFALPLFLLLSMSALILLAFVNQFYLGIAGLTTIAAIISAVAGDIRRRSRTPRSGLQFLGLAYTFGVMNLAILDGWRKFVAGHSESTWQHNRAVVS